MPKTYLGYPWLLQGVQAEETNPTNSTKVYINKPTNQQIPPPVVLPGWGIGQ